MQCAGRPDINAPTTNRHSWRYEQKRPQSAYRHGPCPGSGAKASGRSAVLIKTPHKEGQARGHNNGFNRAPMSQGDPVTPGGNHYFADCCVRDHSNQSRRASLALDRASKSRGDRLVAHARSVPHISAKPGIESIPSCVGHGWNPPHLPTETLAASRAQKGKKCFSPVPRITPEPGGLRSR
jgi:hypothetical protein